MTAMAQKHTRPQENHLSPLTLTSEYADFRRFLPNLADLCLNAEGTFKNITVDPTYPWQLPHEVYWGDGWSV